VDGSGTGAGSTRSAVAASTTMRGATSTAIAVSTPTETSAAVAGNTCRTRNPDADRHCEQHRRDDHRGTADRENGVASPGRPS
jgi:hypothetical protein